MARQKKDDSVQPQPQSQSQSQIATTPVPTPAPLQSSQNAQVQRPVRTISVEDFMRSRDSVITGLTNLQNGIQKFITAYLNHSNQILSDRPNVSTEDLITLANPFGSNYAGGQYVYVSDEKKKRKRPAPDPNAPKRALTAYFLYMQTARPKIREELGEKATPQQVADEGTRRWNAMSEEEQSQYKQQYQVNLAVYREKLKAYREGRPIPEFDDTTAKLLLVEHTKAGKNLEEVSDVDADGEEEQEESTTTTSDSDDEDDEEEEEESPPPKAPSPPPVKRRKSGGKEVVEQAATKKAKAKSVKKDKLAATEKEVSGVKSPEKKKRRKGHSGMSPVSASAPAALVPSPAIPSHPPKPEKREKRSHKKRRE